jgi:hypothetical protein
MSSLNPWTERRILSTDPDHIPDPESWMELRLTYAGFLMGSNKGDPRARHKHEIRKVFHRQLKRFWEHHPMLRQSMAYENFRATKTLVESRADAFARNGYRFVPLATTSMSLHCSLSILFLRPDVPGGLLKSADLDNRLKTLFDALRMPQSKDELGGYDTPGADEDPFFCLLQDDALIANASVSTDMLLEDVENAYDKNHARLVITVSMRPYMVTMENLDFS